MTHSSDADQAAGLRVTPAGARIILLLAIGAFVAQGWYFAGANATWHEEAATHATPPPLRLTMDGSSGQVAGICDDGAWVVTTGQRPQTVLCAAGLAWPVIIMPYIVGIHYWPLQVLRPLHHGDPVLLRRVSLIIGVSALLVLFLLIERVGGSLRAAAAVATASIASPFIILHSLLVTFELAPPLLLGLAALVVVRRPDQNQPLTAGRAMGAGVLFALAILANVKAAVVAIPLIAFGMFESPALRRIPRRVWLTALIACLIVLAPFVFAALADPAGRFGFEVRRRFGIAASRLDPRLLVAEMINGFVFGSDVSSYGDVVSGTGSRLYFFTLVLPALSFFYSAREFAHALRRQHHDVVAAACGGIQLFFLMFAWLAYNQTPAANYSPVVCVYAASMGSTLVAIGQWLARRLGSARAAVALVSALALLSLPVNLYRRGDPRSYQLLSTNLAAEQRLADYLRSSPGGTVVVTHYNLVGVPDVLTGQPSLNIDRHLEQCAREPDPEACEKQIVAAVIAALPAPRFLAPLRPTVVDKASAWRVVQTIEQAAASLGAHARQEAQFLTPTGVAVIGLYAIDRNVVAP